MPPWGAGIFLCRYKQHEVQPWRFRSWEGPRVGYPAGAKALRYQEEQASEGHCWLLRQMLYQEGGEVGGVTLPGKSREIFSPGLEQERHAMHHRRGQFGGCGYAANRKLPKQSAGEAHRLCKDVFCCVVYNNKKKEPTQMSVNWVKKRWSVHATEYQTMEMMVWLRQAWEILGRHSQLLLTEKN